MEKNDYLVLLRGINAGGNNIIKMDGLKKIFEEMGFSDVKTYIQSGNVLCKDYETDKTKLTKKIEKALCNKLNIKINVLVLTLSEMKNILDDIPHKFGWESEQYKYDVIFLIEPLSVKEVNKEIKPTEGGDKIYEGEKVFYMQRLIKKLTGSYLSKIMRMPMWQNVTIRNLNTVKKLYELLLERNSDIKGDVS